jgi:hypothetical protein
MPSPLSIRSFTLKVVSRVKGRNAVHSRVACKHRAQPHAGAKVPHQVYRAQLLQPFPVVQDVLFPADKRRVAVLDTEALHVDPELLQLPLDARDIHRLRVGALSHAGLRPPRRIAYLHCASS